MSTEKTDSLKAKDLIDKLHLLDRKITKLEVHIKECNEMRERQTSTNYMILNRIVNTHHEIRKQDALSLLITASNMLEKTLADKREQLAKTVSLLHKTL